MHETSHIAEIVAGIIALLVVAAATLAVTKKVRLPFTVLLVLIGVGLSQLASWYPDKFPFLQELEISPGLILYVFLPSLIFESAFNLDARALRKNLWPVLLLAIPGLLVSTLMIGLVVAFGAEIPLPAALLLGAILSATDPVAVVALFKKLGAPQRLTILVEGESLFNDATSLVLSKILVSVVLIGAVSTVTVFQGILDFIVVFMGGLAVGVFLGLLTGYLLGKVTSDPLIEITLTTVLAYMSYLVAEEGFHVSGVMATIAGGLVLGGWGRMRVSPEVRTYLEHFWEYIAFVANALIFLMVGLLVDLSALWSLAGLLGWVLLAMLVARAVVVFGLTPLVKKLPEAEEVSRPYQAVMYWGGLRGAIALAIVLSLPAFEFRNDFIALVMGAVLFTLIVQGLTIERLMRMLGLDRPPLADRFARAEGNIVARTEALHRLPELLSGGLYSGPIAARLQARCEAKLADAKKEMDTLRSSELSAASEKQLLLLQALAEEKSAYVEMFNSGQFSERTFRDLLSNVIVQTDAVRHTGGLSEEASPGKLLRTLEASLLRLTSDMPGLRVISERVRLNRVARDFERVWGRYQGSGAVFELCLRVRADGTMSADVIDEVEKMYAGWHKNAEQRIDGIAELYPEFVAAVQERLGARLVLMAEAHAIGEQRERGMLPHSMAEEMREEILHEMDRLRGAEVSKLVVEPGELLKKVPFFQGVPEEQFEEIAARMRAHTYSKGEMIIQQGATGDSLFLIARGVVRVSREADGASRDLATLMAGDFFGEMALVLHETRTATIRAVTPCSVYELRRQDLDAVVASHPHIMDILTAAASKRKQEQQSS